MRSECYHGEGVDEVSGTMCYLGEGVDEVRVLPW